MRVEFEGQTHEFPDDATEAEIQAVLGGGSAPAERSALGQYGRAMALGARTVYSGAASAVTGLPTLGADAAINAAYGAKKLAAKTGLVSEPNPANYYKGGGYLPTTEAVGRKVEQGLDAVGLPRPENGLESAVSNVGGAAVGALTGSGVGGFVAGRIGRFLSAEPAIGAAAAGTGAAATEAVGAVDGDRQLPGWVAPAVGLAAGVGAGTAISGARAATGYVPGFGRVGSNVPGTRDAVANEVLQGMASDPATAARNLRGAGELERAPDFAAPGYRFLSTEAAQDTGLAANKQALRDMAGGQIADLEQGNNVALTRAFEREGAAEGSANVPREQARRGTEDLGRFGLTGPTAGRNQAIEVTDEIRRLERNASGQMPGSSGASRGVNSESAGLLRSVAERREIPTTLPSGEPGPPRIEYWATPERLQSFRSDLSQSLGAAPAGAALPVPSAAMERRTTGTIMGRADDMISDQVGTVPGPQGTELDYPAYMARQRGLRQESDERSFMRAQMEKVAPGTNPITGANEFQIPKLAKMMNEGQRAATVPGSQNPRMTINSLNPARQDFLRRAEELGQLANFSNSKGLASAGSSTGRRLSSDVTISDMLTASQAPYERALSLASRVPGVGLAGRFAGKVFDMTRKEAGVTNVQRVKNRLGEFETNREAALQMLTGRTLPARGLKISAKRQAGRTARYGGQSFLASQYADQRR